MSKRHSSMLKRLDKKQAAQYVLSAENSVESMRLPEPLGPQLFGQIDDAIAVREEHGLTIDPTSSEEVSGLADAVLGGYDHLQQVRKQLRSYIRGIVQTDQLTLDSARQAQEAAK